MIQRLKPFLVVIITALVCLTAGMAIAQTAPALSPSEKAAIKRTIDAIDTAAKALEAESVPVARVGLKNTSAGLDALASAASTPAMRSQASTLLRDVTALTNRLNAGGKSGIARNYKELLVLQDKIKALNTTVTPAAAAIPAPVAAPAP